MVLTALVLIRVVGVVGLVRTAGQDLVRTAGQDLGRIVGQDLGRVLDLVSVPATVPIMGLDLVRRPALLALLRLVIIRLSRLSPRQRSSIYSYLQSRKTFPRDVRGTADPSASLGMTKERATFR
jgi:hypothetical protein